MTHPLNPQLLEYRQEKNLNMKGWGKDFGNLKILPKWIVLPVLFDFKIVHWKWDDDLNLKVCKGFKTAAMLLENTSLPSFCFLVCDNPRTIQLYCLIPESRTGSLAI